MVAAASGKQPSAFVCADGWSGSHAHHDARHCRGHRVVVVVIDAKQLFAHLRVRVPAGPWQASVAVAGADAMCMHA